MELTPIDSEWNMIPFDMRSPHDKPIPYGKQKPLYQKVRDYLIDEIHTGTWHPGDRILSEHELCDRFHVSRSTAQRALNDLLQEGILTRRQGLGTFVADPKLEKASPRFRSFADAACSLGLQQRAKVLKQEIRPATVQQARSLHRMTDEPLIRLRRLRFLDGCPFMLEVTYIPYMLAPGLEKKPFEQQSLCKVLADRYGIYVSAIQELFEPVLLSSEEGRLLKEEFRTPAIIFDRTAFSVNNRPVFISRRLVPGSNCKLYSRMR